MTISMLKFKANRISFFKLILVFISFLLSTDVLGQKKSIFITSHTSHIGLKSNSWFNAIGFKIGFKHKFETQNSFTVDFGHMGFHSNDKEEVDISEALNRYMLHYKILRAGYQQNIIAIHKLELGFLLGGTIRHLSSVEHTFAASDTFIDDTKNVLVKTNYEKQINLGYSFGIYGTLLFHNRLNSTIYFDLENYGENRHSFLSIGLRLNVEI